MAASYSPKAIKPTASQLLKKAEENPFLVDVPLIAREQLDAGSRKSYEFGIAFAGPNSGKELRNAIKCLGVFFRRECRHALFDILDEAFDDNEFKLVFTYIADFDAPVLITGFALFRKVSYAGQLVWELCAAYLLPNSRHCGKMRDMLLGAELDMDVDFYFVQEPITTAMYKVLEKRGMKASGSLFHVGDLPE